MPINPIIGPVLPALPVVPKALGVPPVLPAQLAAAGDVEEPKINADDRVAFLVAGVNYPRIAQGNVLDPKKHRTYFRYAHNYKQYLLTNKVVDRVFVMDFLTGEVRVYKRGGTPDGELTRPRTKPLVINNYRHRYGKKFTLKKPSENAPWGQKLRLYYTGMHELATQLSGDPDADVPEDDYVRARGQRVAKERSLSVSYVYELIHFAWNASVKEVHFIGHAFLGGPIIVNTPGDNKKEYDKDGRVSDFTNPDLDRVFGKRLGQFQGAFTHNARLTIWGCENNKPARDLIIEAKAKEKAGKPIREELKKLKEILEKTYAAHLAKIAKKPVISALPGTYSVHEGEPNDDKSGFSFQPIVMHVNLEKCGHILEFYQKHLGIKFPTSGSYKGHPTFGRGYAFYDP